MKYFKKLVGERIYLSPMFIEDAEKYVEWFSDFKMTDGIGSSSKVMNIESEKKYIQETLEKGEFNFAIINLENDELIGNCGIMNISYLNRIAELGIFIGLEYNRNKGYVAEVLK